MRKRLYWLKCLGCGALKNMCLSIWQKKCSLAELWKAGEVPTRNCFIPVVAMTMGLFFFIRFYLQSMKRQGRVWWTDCRILLPRRSCETVGRLPAFHQVVVWGVFGSTYIWTVCILAINLSTELLLGLKGKKFENPIRLCSPPRHPPLYLWY